MAMSTFFPNDLLIEILSRLPVKSIGKFKCVSREWFLILTDPHFILIHKKRCLRNTNILFVKENDEYEVGWKIPLTNIDIWSLKSDECNDNVDFSFYLDDYELNVKLLSSRENDLICIVMENMFYVCNPATQLVIKLPDSKRSHHDENTVGMGYVKERNEYVIVNLYYLGWGYNVMLCEMLRLKDGDYEYEWKPVKAICILLVSGCGSFVHNTFYWMYNDEDLRHELDVVVSFDIENEKFGIIKLPEGRVNRFSEWSLIEFGDKLCLFESYRRSDIAEIWMLKDAKNSVWICEYKIDFTMFPKGLRGIPNLFELWDEKKLNYALSKGFDKYDFSWEVEIVKQYENCYWIQRYTPGFFKL